MRVSTTTFSPAPSGETTCITDGQRIVSLFQFGCHLCHRILLFGSNFQPCGDGADGTGQLAKPSLKAINCIKSGSDLSSAKAKAASGGMMLAGLDATDTASVWDDNQSVNYQRPCWLRTLIG
jgi:hypothetical protein